MSARDRKRRKDEVRGDGPAGFMELCRGASPGDMPEHCGDQMREMMSRRMPCCQDTEDAPGGTGTGRREES